MSIAERREAAKELTADGMSVGGKAVQLEESRLDPSSRARRLSRPFRTAHSHRANAGMRSSS
jgi:hypothetical protein